jgi:membrane associated rhomboid family serine protease
MFFPIGDDQIQGGSKPIVSYSFLALNILVFLYQFSLQTSLADADSNFVTEWGAIPLEISQGVDLQTLISSIFLHGSWMHLIGNMLFLWVFADNIEAVIGSTRFFIFYMLGGILAGLTQVVLDPSSNIPCVGASGAIAAVLGAYLVMFPGSKVKILFLLFFQTFQVPALMFLGFWGVQQLWSGFGTLGTGSASDSGVAVWAHIGGFVFGVLVGFLLRNTVKTQGELV